MTRVANKVNQQRLAFAVVVLLDTLQTHHTVLIHLLPNPFWHLRTCATDDLLRTRTAHRFKPVVLRYMMSRAMGLLIKDAAARGLVPTIPGFSAWVFTLCQVPNMSAFMFEEELIDPDYCRLIYKWSRDMSNE